jgi:serine/threonine protein kinase
MQTMSGTIKGKYGYMAPEYLAGRIDARADLFAVGVIAHELLTNRPLFTTNDDIETLERVRGMPISPPSHRNPLVPGDIDHIVMTALERDPDRRWQHATALRTAMTTLTKRLGMVVTNPEVVQWLDTMDFDSDTLTFDDKDPSTSMGDSVVISVEQPLTVRLGGEPIIPPLPMPVGTPAKTITAQPNVPTIEISKGEDKEYAAAVEKFEAADAPTQVRAPEPPAAPVKPAAGHPTRLTAVLLVILAAAVAATAVYFLLPLIT